jgi:nicotinate-nucleotide adenylyltransferase
VSDDPGVATKRIGILGGSFDPVHNAHVALARLALEHLQLDEVLWVPVGAAWQKARQLSDAAHRVAMIELAIEGEPRFRLERCELDRAGPSYMIDTVGELQLHTPGADWYLLIGQDQYANLHTWKRWQDLLQCVTLVVAGRIGAPPAPSPEVAAIAHRMVPLPLPAMAISATGVRQLVAHPDARGPGVADMVPARVARYIEQHHLYS